MMPVNRRLTSALITTSALLLAGTALAQPQPAGSFTVAEPEVAYPLPVVDNYIAQTGKNAAGEEINKYDRSQNPVIMILSGFDDIWNLDDDAWRQGGANGDGAKDYSHVKIVNPAVWAANMAYVLDVTGPARTKQQALEAYLDDRENHGYSVIDGFGPMADAYRAASGATSTISHTLADFDPDTVITVKEEDEGNNAGAEGSELSDFVAFMAAMRGPEGTTSPSKYFYASPRPWRMADNGAVIETGSEAIADKNFETYDSHTAVVPALLYARETRGRNKDGGFPSGHTNAGYLSAITYAYAFPERYEELLTRASELGENRIRAGMHSPLDVIGGRIMATAVAAAYLNDPRLAALKTAAYDNMQSVMAENLAPGETLMTAAHQPSAGDRWANAAANAALYRQRMTYGLPRDEAQAGADMIVPKGAEVLLETRQPYLTPAQRRVVLYTTGLGGGYPVLDKSNGWGRIDLVAAAGGYGSFPGDVTVDMDGSKGDFNAEDRWVHPISGLGMLTKNGSGKLTLAGDNSYEGGTTLNAGTLVAERATSLGTGDLLVTGGTLTLGPQGLVLPGEAEINGGTLVVAATEFPAEVFKAGVIKGQFDSITDTDGKPLDAAYADGTITVTPKLN
ncbi:phosphatase PAP2 family protein [Martelella alba]|uniref:Phosphatase PAP2 family protein n=1 Tax=Martelella alba TaxID=2590451 RepID=A0A506U9H0_9HYPH|nr:phosphatase PAP2 family protein [Martelella alba]TPW30520.1 phosphatase PAP2 family protein [Martelella alba]